MKNVIVLVTALLSSQGLKAAEIARDIRDGESDNQSFIELGFRAAAIQIPLIGFNDQELDNPNDAQLELDLEIGLQTRLEFRGFFAEYIDEGFNNITLGYNAYSTESTSVDIVVAQMFQNIGRDEYIGFESVDDRDEDVHIGVRSNHYFGEYQVQLEFSRDVAGAHDGVIAAAQVGRGFQYRNWNLHGVAGVRYFSENVLQHYFGVSDAESTATLASYDAGGGFMPTVQIGGTLPINERWIVRTSAEYSMLPDAVSDSPLAQGNDVVFLGVGIYRVFQPW